MPSNVAVVAGALGIVGRALVAHLETLEGWNVIALSRRSPGPEARSPFIAVDLADAECCRARLAGLGDVTHVFYAAYAPAASLAEEASLNTRMLVNLVETLEPAAPDLRHIQLMQGSKWYGNHLGPYRTPAREDDPRHGKPCFYYDQQDWLVARRSGKRWNWSALRPHGVLGLASGSTMSQLTAMALYATLEKEAGRPLCWPGTEAAFDSVYQFTESAYLARGCVWAATSERTANQAINFTNGDLVRWRHLWPSIAEAFGMEPGGVRTQRLADAMADMEPLWAAIRARHGLRAHTLAELTNWSFADFVFSCGYDQISDLTRARNAGWVGANPSPEMYVRLIRELRAARIIP